jgi:hypothetical protein
VYEYPSIFIFSSVFSPLFDLIALIRLGEKVPVIERVLNNGAPCPKQLPTPCYYAVKAIWRRARDVLPPTKITIDNILKDQKPVEIYFEEHYDGGSSMLVLLPSKEDAFTVMGMKQKLHGPTMASIGDDEIAKTRNTLYKVPRNQIHPWSYDGMQAQKEQERLAAIPLEQRLLKLSRLPPTMTKSGLLSVVMAQSHMSGAIRVYLPYLC